MAFEKIMRRTRFLTVALAGITALTSLSLKTAKADDPALDDAYGRGVHAYFTGDASGAIIYLTAAIKAGSRDARVYYFRGLAYLNMGDQFSAQDDFRTGANLETTELDRFYDIGKSLERVQGSARLALERYRSSARIAAARLREQRRMQRYESIPRAQPAGPAMSPAAPATTPMEAAPTETPATPPAADPFGS
jgi:tetratricopeptide (TPR) repeat protein